MSNSPDEAATRRARTTLSRSKLGDWHLLTAVLVLWTAVLSVSWLLLAMT
jgi:hypothetical protein